MKFEKLIYNLKNLILKLNKIKKTLKHDLKIKKKS